MPALGSQRSRPRQSRCFPSSLLACAVALGCGSQTTVPVPKRLGSVDVEASSSGLQRRSTATFNRPPDPERVASRGCLAERVGDCLVSTCEELAYGQPLVDAPLSAGPVTLTGLSTSLELVEARPGHYESALHAGSLWNAGRSITVEVAGAADFPAMQAHLRVPSSLTIVSPEGPGELVVRSDEDVAIAWSKNGASKVFVTLSVVTLSSENELVSTPAVECDFGAQVSGAAIPGALLNDLPKPPGWDSYRIDVFTAAVAEVRDLDAKLRFQATDVALSTALRLQSGEL